MVHYVYLITNKINNKKYIGKHSGELDDDYLGSGENIRAAIKKYGKENFEKSILYIAETEEESYAMEEKLIKEFNAVESEEYYNISPGGEYKYKKVSPRDRSYTKTEEYRKKMSEACSGKNNGMYGRHHTEESKRKMSEHRTGKTAGEKNGMYGRHHTEEAKKKISENSIGKTAGEKNGMYGHSKDNALNGKWVEMYDENYVLLRTFKAKTAVLDFLGVKSHKQLDKAIKEGTLYKGYYWKVISRKKKSVETK